MQLPDIFLDFLRKARKDQLVHALEYVFEEFNNQMSSVDDQLHDKQKIINLSNSGLTTMKAQAL